MWLLNQSIKGPQKLIITHAFETCVGFSRNIQEGNNKLGIHTMLNADKNILTQIEHKHIPSVISPLILIMVLSFNLKVNNEMCFNESIEVSSRIDWWLV